MIADLTTDKQHLQLALQKNMSHEKDTSVCFAEKVGALMYVCYVSQHRLADNKIQPSGLWLF